LVALLREEAPVKTPLLYALALIACGKTNSEVAPAPTTTSAKVADVRPVSAPVAPTIVTVTDIGAKVPVETAVLEKLVLGVESCPLEGHQVVPKCAGMEALAAGTKGKIATLELPQGGELLRHASPAIRVTAAGLMPRSNEGREAIADAAAVERDPGVLQAFIRVVAEDGARVPKVGAMLLAVAGHADQKIRLAAVDALAAPANRGLGGGAEKLVALAQSDGDIKVRQAACEKAGKLGNEALLPLYEKATASTADADMYAACMEGLVAMFHNHPVFDTSSEAAYRLFLRRLEAKPRTEHAPPWSVMSTFCYFSHDADLDKLAAWKKQAGYFKPDDVKRVMASVISDRSASWMARSAAIESMVGLGASKDELEALKKGFDTADRRDKPVLEKLATVLAN
jgi:hypothetical protein